MSCVPHSSVIMHTLQPLCSLSRGVLSFLILYSRNVNAFEADVISHVPNHKLVAFSGDGSDIFSVSQIVKAVIVL